MRKDAHEELPDALCDGRKLLHRCGHHLTYRLVEADHFLKCRCVEPAVLLPSLQDTRSQRTVFRYQRIDLETMRLPVVGVSTSNPVNAESGSGRSPCDFACCCASVCLSRISAAPRLKALAQNFAAERRRDGHPGG